MKKIVCILSMLFIVVFSQAQTLKGSVNVTTGYSNYTTPVYCEGNVMFAVLSEVVETPSHIDPTMYLYNKDLTLYKKFKNNKYQINSIQFISDHLFNDDDKIEFLIKRLDLALQDTMFLMNEDGEVLKTFHGRTPQIFTKDGKSYLSFLDGSLEFTINSKFDIYELKNVASSNSGNVGIKGDKGDKGETGLSGKNGVDGRDGVCTCNQTSTKSAVVNELVLYPNPSKGNFYIRNLKLGSKIEVNSSLGYNISTFIFDNENNASDFFISIPGTYFITIKDNEDVIIDVKKLIVE